MNTKSCDPADTQHCLACDSSDVTKWFEKLSNLDKRIYPVFKCKQCGSAFINPRPTQEYLEYFYSGVQPTHARNIHQLDKDEQYKKIIAAEEEYPNSTLDAKRIVSICSEIAVGNRFLDIGAGYGFFSNAAMNQGFKVTAIEPTQECRSIFQSMNGFEPMPGMLTPEFVEGHLNEFDVILLSQVLEHITDLNSTLFQLYALLAPRGIIAIAVPHFGSWLSKAQGKGDMFISPPEHLNFFSEDGLKALFHKHKMHCVKLHTISRADPRRIKAKIKLPLVSSMSTNLILRLLQLSEMFQKGMFLNAYFRKD